LAEGRAAVNLPRGPVYGVHDVQCEAHYLSSTGRPPNCGCAERVDPGVALPSNTEDSAGAQAPADPPTDHGEPEPTERDLARLIADRLTGNELLPGRWVILDATPDDDEIVLRVVTWGPSVETSARTEARYVLKLVQEDAPTP